MPGTATILDYDLRTHRYWRNEGFGVVPETSNAYTDLTAGQNLMLMGELYGLPVPGDQQHSSDLLSIVGLLDRKNQKVQACSKGIKQRLILAMALIHKPELLFLDEHHKWSRRAEHPDDPRPAPGPDKQGTTIFLTTHNIGRGKPALPPRRNHPSGKMIAIDAPEELKTAIDRVHKIEVSFRP